MKHETALALVLVVLVLIAGVQVVEFATLSGTVTALVTSGVPAKASAVPAPGALPASLQGLPSQVGGC